MIDNHILIKWFVGYHLFEAPLDHSYLNDHPAFSEENPSSERIARFLHEAITGRLESAALSVSFVRVWESEDSAATYRL